MHVSLIFQCQPPTIRIHVIHDLPPPMAFDLALKNQLISMASAIPEDVLVHILVRLPANSLLRCLCVCKSWHSLISSPVFVSNHRNYIATSASTSTLVFRLCGPGTRRLRYTLHSDDDSSTEIAEFLPPSPNPSSSSRILASVNGLICILDSNSSLMLWNPAIRKSLILPQNPIVEITDPDSSPPVFGFGFDPSADDYKVVRVGKSVEIYKLSASSWSRVNGFGNSSSLFPRQAYLKGVIHWLSEDSKIVGFDLRIEAFTVMNLPVDLQGKRMEDLAIAAWCGLLALFELESSRSICLWVMNEYRDSESWTRQCDISCVSFPSRVKGIASNGRILVEDCLGLLFWFDPQTRETAELAIRDVGDVDMFHVKAYKESLVLLGVRDEMIGLDPLEKQEKGKKLRVC